MATLSQTQIDTLKNKGLTMDKIEAIATQRGFSMPKQSLGSTLINSERKFGQSIAGAIGGAFPNLAGKSMIDEANTRNRQVQENLLTKIKEKKANGEDTSKLLNALKTLDTEVNFYDILNTSTGGSLDKTGKQIAGEALGVATDIIGFGALGGAGKAGKGFLSTLKQGAKEGAKFAGAFGASQGVSEAMQDNKSTGEIIGQGIQGGIIGGAVGGALGVSLPLSGALLKKLTPTGIKTLGKNSIIRATLSKDGRNVVKEASQNKYFTDVLSGKTTSSSIGDGVANLFKRIQTQGISKMGTARRTLLSDTSQIPTNSTVRKAYDAVRKELNLGDSKVNREILFKKGLSKPEANKIMSVIEAISTRAGKPVTKISTKRLDEIISAIDKLKPFEKTDTGSIVISSIRREINKQFPSKFQTIKGKSSKNIKAMTKEIKDILGVPKDKLLRDELSNQDQIATRINQLVKSFGDPNKKAKTFKALLEFDKKYNTDFAKQIEAMHLAGKFEKVLEKNKDILSRLGVKSPLGTGAGVTLFSAFSGDGIGAGDIAAGMTVASIVSALSNPKLRVKAIQWLMNASPEVKNQVFKKAPQLRDALSIVINKLL